MERIHRASRQARRRRLFADSIDGYQLDEIQFDALTALGEQHPLHRAGLADRCFAAATDDPLGVIERVAETIC